MDTRDQQQAIVDKLLGNTGRSLPPLSGFDEPWRTFFRYTRRASNFTAAELNLYRIANDMAGGNWDRKAPSFDFARDLVELLPPGDAFSAYPSLLEMQPQLTDVHWLWPGWIPRGMVTLLGAAPGMGKSLFALDLARRIIAGEPMPDGAPPQFPTVYKPKLGWKVLIVDAEGAPALLNQRARAWQIDPRRLFLLVPPLRHSAIPSLARPGSMTKGNRTEGGGGAEGGSLIDLSLAHHQELLRNMCYDAQPALVVVDSLAAAASRGETTIEGARAILGFLASLAREYDTGMLVIHHLRKQAAGSQPGFRPAAEDLRGSSHLSAAARSVLALSLARPPVPPGLQLALARYGLAQPGPVRHGRRLEVVKSNLCDLPPPLEITLDAAPGEGGEPPPEGVKAPVGMLAYLQVPPDVPAATQTENCALWLLEYLAEAGEPRPPREVIRAAREEGGFAQATVYRARKTLGPAVVDVGHSRYDSHKRWALAQAESEGVTTPEDTVA